MDRSLVHSKGKSAAHAFTPRAQHAEDIDIIQIGASDGILGDPLRPFISEHTENINIIFFEPQKEPFQKLHELYRGIPHFKCVNKAIGATGSFPFYCINERFRQLYKKKTGLHIGTGANSFVKENLTRRMKKIGVHDFDPYIDVEMIESGELLDELRGRSEFEDGIDLLQIDCEGYDDEVIYHSAIDRLKPRLINFEIKNLSADKLQKLTDYLVQRHYRIIQWTGSDTLALKN